MRIQTLFKTGLGIRIHFLRIQIQIGIRIQLYKLFNFVNKITINEDLAVTDTPQFFLHFSLNINKFTIINNFLAIYQFFFHQFFSPGSALRMRIRIPSPSLKHILPAVKRLNMSVPPLPASMDSVTAGTTIITR